MAIMTHEALVQELQMHVAAVAADAAAGDYDCREWLCKSFPGHTGHFRQVWHQQPPAPAPKPTRNRPHDRRLKFDRSRK